MHIGTAGWNIPGPYSAQFPEAGTHLQRYGAKLNAVEINSSFSVPADFRFAVKLPRSVTHERRLKDCDDQMSRFLQEIGGLGSKLGVILVQLPPSLVYDTALASGFFRRLGSPAAIACEPRHASWFTDEADAALRDMRIARVAADPPRAIADGVPGGWPGLAYWRLHGSPKIYYSSYDDAMLGKVAGALRPGDWCIFDNTAAFAALGNALSLSVAKNKVD